MFAKGRITTTGDVFRDEKSLAFDGSNDYVELVGTFSYNVHSISAWVKPKAIVGSSTIFDYRDANNDGIFLTLADGDVMYQIDNTDAHYDSVLTLNKWWHIVATNDGSTSTIYVNGVSVETADTSGETINVSSSAIPRIGARSHTSADNYFNGNISEVAIYNSALTINQVKTIYNGREPYNHKEGVASGNLKAWYRMGDGVLDDYALIGDETNATLGSDLITNGSFDADSDWTKGTGWTISGGSASCDGSQSSGSSLYQEDGTAFGSPDEQGVWKITFEISGYSAGTLQTGIGGYTYSATVSGDGVYTHYLLPTNTSSNARVYINANSSFVGNVNYVKTQLVNGNASVMKNMSATDIEGDTP